MRATGSVPLASDTRKDRRERISNGVGRTVVPRLPRGLITAAPMVVVVLVVATLATIAVRSGPSARWVPVIAAPAPLVSASCPTDPSVYGIPRPENSPLPLETDPPTGSIPAGFMPVRFRLCVIDSVASAAVPIRWVVRERIGVVTPALITALSQPDAQGDPSCPTYTVTTTLFFLADVDGHTIRPHLPQALCGETKPDVLSLISRLPYSQITISAKSEP
jgi:hypothetical protein